MFRLFFRRRNSANSRKKSASTSASNPTVKSSDKAPLLEQTKPNSAADATKRKLVPERTIQITDTGGTPKPKAANDTKTDTPAAKPTFSAADSGIYGADLSEEAKPVSKTPPTAAAAIPEPNKGAETDSIAVETTPAETETLLPKTSETNPTENIIPTVVVNPLNEPISVVLPEEQPPPPPPPLPSSSNHLPLDTTIQSAYPNIIDATTSENEGTICGSTIDSRRTSLQKSMNSINHEPSINLEAIVINEQTDQSLSHNIIPFNPLHVILKDANKYYTTEYI